VLKETTTKEDDESMTYEDEDDAYAYSYSYSYSLKTIFDQQNPLHEDEDEDEDEDEVRGKGWEQQVVQRLSYESTRLVGVNKINTITQTSMECLNYVSKLSGHMLELCLALFHFVQIIIKVTQKLVGIQIILLDTTFFVFHLYAQFMLLVFINQTYQLQSFHTKNIYKINESILEIIRLVVENVPTEVLNFLNSDDNLHLPYVKKCISVELQERQHWWHRTKRVVRLVISKLETTIRSKTTEVFYHVILLKNVQDFLLQSFESRDPSAFAHLWKTVIETSAIYTDFMGILNKNQTAAAAAAAAFIEIVPTSLSEIDDIDDDDT